MLAEAGATLAGALLRADLVDEIVLYQAPKILGTAARGLFELPENPAALASQAHWQTVSADILDGDMKWVLRRAEAV